MPSGKDMPPVTQDELVTTMSADDACHYLYDCVMARRQGMLGDRLLGLVKGSRVAMVFVNDPEALDQLLGRNLFCVVVGPRASKNRELTKAVWRRIASRFTGVNLPDGVPRPCMILIEGRETR